MSKWRQQFNYLINQYYVSLPRRVKRWIFRSIDLVAVILSVYLAFALRFDLFEAWSQVQNFMPELLLFIPVKLSVFWLFGIYKPILRYAGEEFLATALKAVLTSTGVLALLWLLLQFHFLPRSIFILDAINSYLLLAGSRIVMRWIIYHIQRPMQHRKSSESILVYGAGSAGSQLMQSLSGDGKYRISAFVDDDSQLHKQVMHGIIVYDPVRIPELIEKYNIDSILLAIPKLGRQRRNKLIESLKEYSLPIKTIPEMGEIISGKISISDIRNIDILDLLGREEVEPVHELIEKNILGKVVLVSGAGGSIGSELCRQILAQNPKHLLLLERNEFALYSIESELNELTSETRVTACLGSVTNAPLVEKILKQYQVQTIYHAAAYKHVPLVEANPSEGVFNNILGTRTMAQAAQKSAVETFVLISTDKAVRPTNIMGATKRVAEQVLQALAAEETNNTKFIMVRFGNVLDSAGSVVPRFRQQIAEGKNITLTHPEITRFFMSIPEASRLVIQAGALGKGGDVFLLDMGEPVKIMDLAKQMIKLSGLKLGEDIDIEITGLRPGEKLYEELLIDHTNSEGTSHPKIFSAKESFMKWPELQFNLESLKKAALSDDRERLRKVLKTTVPEYIPESAKSEPKENALSK